VFELVLPEKIQGVPAWFVRLAHIEAATGEAFVGSGWKQLGKVLVQSQPTFAYQHLWHTSTEQALWLLVFYAVSLGLMGGVLHFVLLPLKAIERSALEVQVKTFRPIDLKPRAPELASVVKAMNQMSARVGEMLDAEALRKQAYDDELTGLANRRGYELQLTDLLQGEHPFSLGTVIAVEIDDMRLLSRVHGFAAGQELMLVLARAARGVFAAVAQPILARNNEYSFSFVVVDVSHDQATGLARKLRRVTLAGLAEFEPAQMVCINMGVAFFHQEDTRSDVFARADLAVESARQSDLNGFTVLPDSHNAHASLGSHGWRTLIGSELVMNRWQLLRQPVVRLRDTDELIHDECMARLVDTRGELISASTFMPMAARHRLMLDIDRAMVMLALAHLKAGGNAVGKLAINLSPQSLGEPSFIDWLKPQIDILPPAQAARVSLEVSEFGALRHPAGLRALRVLCRHCHVGFGIDHFDMAPQAVQMLRTTVPDYVKLSDALSHDLLEGEDSRELLASFVKLAHSLDVMVIAQKIEDHEQVAALLNVGVDGGQGFHFGAPV
jgi:EAL domain-containing protein (putative c-di-GMP-specific phosphodiesterase class I)/GGDEF domain-containing protein